MRKYQIFEIAEGGNHAGTKANGDVSIIAKRMGYEIVPVRQINQIDSIYAKLQRQIVWEKDLSTAYKTIEKNSIVILQHPFHNNQITRNRILKKLKYKKNVKFICVVHDVEKLRQWRYNDYYKKEFDFMMEYGDAFVVHNCKMLEYFKSIGCPEGKLVNLEIFDYLNDDFDENKEIIFEKSITVAGNLDTSKCGYISDLGKIGVKVNLYGPNFDTKLNLLDNITYYGSFPPNDIPNHLNKGFGLVWDGNSIDGCQGQTGQYLKYNNPHKLSLYLSSGIPVVIWKDAAEAEFVEKYHVGITVDSLNNLKDVFDTLSEEQYKLLVENARRVGKSLRKGEYMTKAINNALAIVTK